ncbi:tachylectin-related carbohydrate-binding protein [Crenothrix polyspora]|uniref:Tachylectin 2 domain-containing protein n=1 Tax=Crenothrix polyspora TaxID=360316 RepID=A0A1R4H8Q1_9GAMM|nr:tachylectin-related carbohydrate-binding protein [Crenothrix polyspora]SJM92556.1 conserved exported hypothetical protein [Crenothrix polyspora]
MKSIYFLINRCNKATPFLLCMFMCLSGLTLPAHAIQPAYAAFADGDGDIYVTTKNGTLHWLQHTGRMSGADSWVNFGASKVVGDKATSKNLLNTKMFSGDDGIIYTINNKGQLLWSRHDGRFNGSQVWTNGNKLSIIGNGWNKYSHVFSGGDGIIYAITTDGKMLWFRHTGWLDGTAKWTADSGKQVSKGWVGVLKVFSGGNGVIYSIMPSGRLRWHRHDGRLTGTDNWVNAGVHSVVGYNWQGYRQVFTGGDGIIYAITAKGDLLWHRHTGWLTGKDTWAPIPATDAGRVIMSGLAIN